MEERVKTNDQMSKPRLERWPEKIMLLRWKLADCLSLLACRLRSQKWYRGDCWAGVPGNRAAELRQSVWERCVALELTAENKDPEWLDKIDRELSELGQIAGENWGHIHE